MIRAQPMPLPIPGEPPREPAPPPPPPPALQPLNRDDAARIAHQVAVQRGYVEFRIREIEADDGAWEIEGKGRRRDGSKGKLELKIDRITHRVFDIEDEQRHRRHDDDDDDDDDD